MGKSHIGSGSVSPGAIVAVKTAEILFTQTGSFQSGIEIPANHKIIDIIVDFPEPWNSATSDALAIGVEGVSDNLFGNVPDMQVSGRAVFTVDEGQAEALADVGPQDVGIFLTITSVGGSLDEGIGQVAVLYSTTEDNF
jgi:hypothetical protein